MVPGITPQSYNFIDKEKHTAQDFSISGGVD
jgi:hypothetical protein